MAVHFDGYTLDKSGRPTFRYSLDEGGKGAVLRVAETPMPIKASAATGLGRRFTVETPSGYQTWFLAGVASKEPRALHTTGGETVKPVEETPESGLGASGLRVVLPGDGDKAIVLEAIGTPDRTSWRFVPKPGGGWLVLLRLPETKEGWKGQFELVLWSLTKSDNRLIRDLTTR